MRHKVITFIGGFILLMVLASMGNNKDAKTSTTVAQTSNTQSTPKPIALSKSGISSNVEIAVIGLESKKTVGNNEFTQKKASGIFKVVQLSIKNNQKDAITVDSNSFKLVDDQGREFTPSYEASYALASNVGGSIETFFLKKINPGILQSGYIAFDIPEDAKGLILKAKGGMTGDEISLKFE